MTYSIPEANYEELKQKLSKIEKKCLQYGCHFQFHELGHEFRKHELSDGTTTTVKYFNIEVEGTATINGWELISVIEHIPTGNIVYQVSNAICTPSEYYTADSNCDHCNSHRHRNQTCIIYNQQSKEFKQVGTTCLKLYTGGLSAELAAASLQFLKTAEDYCSRDFICGVDERYYNLKEYLMCAISCINDDGYHKTDSEHPTRDAAFKMYQDFREGMKLNPSYDEVETEANEAIHWILNTEDSNDYIHNLKAICGAEYIKSKHFGFVASFIPTYRRELQRLDAENQAKMVHEADMKSDFVGTIGDVLEFDVATAECVASWDGNFGYTYIYRFRDVDGNVYIWKTGKGILCENVKSIRGKVKDHFMYKDIKQTILTRCRV